MYDIFLNLVYSELDGTKRIFRFIDESESRNNDKIKLSFVLCVTSDKNTHL